jgi:hypothetical protein
MYGSGAAVGKAGCKGKVSGEGLLYKYVRFVVLAAVAMKSFIFRDKTSCSPTFPRVISSPKRLLTFKELHGVISRKREIFTASIRLSVIERQSTL